MSISYAIYCVAFPSRATTVFANKIKSGASSSDVAVALQLLWLHPADLLLPASHQIASSFLDSSKCSGTYLNSPGLSSEHIHPSPLWKISKVRLIHTYTPHKMMYFLPNGGASGGSGGGLRPPYHPGSHGNLSKFPIEILKKEEEEGEPTQSCIRHCSYHYDSKKNNVWFYKGLPSSDWLGFSINLQRRIVL